MEKALGSSGLDCFFFSFVFLFSGSSSSCPGVTQEVMARSSG